VSYHYRVYGLHLESNREIGLLPAEPPAKPDLIVDWTSNGSESAYQNQPWVRVLTAELKQRQGIALWRAVTAQGVSTKLRFDSAKAHIDFFLDSSQERLWIKYSKMDAASDLHSYFVGPVLGCVLRLRGILCLHASVVKIDDRAVAILGRKKSGKSTCAAGLTQMGAALLSDDMAVLSPKNDGFLVHPGYPQIRLWPQSIEAIYPGRGDLPKVYSHREKRYLPLGVESPAAATFWPRASPLSVIYVLEEIEDPRTGPRVEAVAPQDKAIALIRNTFGSYVVSDENRTNEFQLVAQLSRTIPIRRLVFARNLTRLAAQTRAILEDVNRLKSGAQL
jgi:hypothetical protein